MAGFVSTHSLARPLTWPTTRAGTPTAIMPSGTTIPGGTVAPAAIRARRPTTTPSRTVAPLPTSASAPMTAPCTTHRWPTVAPSPISVTGSSPPCSTEPSWTFAPHRTTIGPKSARSTAPYPDGGLGLDPDVPGQAHREPGRGLVLHVAGDVSGHDRITGVGLQLAVHDLVGVGRVRHAKLGERAEREVAAEDAAVEIERLPGAAVEVEIRVKSRCHGFLPTGSSLSGRYPLVRRYQPSWPRRQATPRPRR